VKEKRRINRWRVIWIVAASLIVILAALILIPSDIFERPRHGTGAEFESTIPGVDKETAETGSGEENADKREETGPAGVTQPGEEAGPDEAPDEGTAPQNQYFIIAGSFQNLANASEMQDRLKARGYPSEVIITANRLYRVSVASYATKGEALQALEGIKSEPGLESCWLLSN
jgi:cell division septation protein DedD